MNLNWLMDQRSRKRLFKNKGAVFGLFIIGFSFLIVFAGSWIRPDSSEFANRQDLSLAVKQPGFSVNMIKLKRQNPLPSSENFLTKHFIGVPESHQWVAIDEVLFENEELHFKKYSDNNDGQWIAIKLAKAIYPASQIVNQSESGVWIKTNGDSKEISFKELAKIFQEEHIQTKTFWLGTDRYGRDMVSRLMAGTAISLSVGFIAVSISLIVGLFFGALAGYFRGRLDDIIMWFINVIWSIPTLLLVIAISLVLGKGYWQVFVAVGLTMWVEVARVVRGQILSIREKEYVTAAVALGYSHTRIILKHVLPNAFSPVIVISSANFASAILIEAGLSFLGIGAAPPQASWGRMIADHKGFIITGDAYLAILPGAAIVLLVLSFMLLGNGLRDALDTKGNN